MPPLDWVLFARFMDGGSSQDTNNYGDQKEGSECGSKREQEAGGSTVDVSRNTFSYFSLNPDIYLGNITSSAEATNIFKQAVNRAVNFLGKDYVLVGDKVYVFDGTSWSTSLTMTNKLSAASNSLGLYPTYFGDAPQLVTAWADNGSSTWRWAHLNGDTDTWTQGLYEEGRGLPPIDSQGGILTEIHQGDTIYYLTSSTAQMGYYKYAQRAGGVITLTQSSRHPMDFCTYNSELYLMNHDGSGNIQILKVLPSEYLDDLGTTEFQLDFSTGLPSDIGGIDIGDSLFTGNEFEGRPLIFVDNVYDSGNVDGATNNPTMWTYFASEAKKAGWDDLNKSTNQTNHGLRAIPFRADANGVLEDVSQTNMATGFRRKPFKLGHDLEEKFFPDEFPYNVLFKTGVKSRKDEKMVLRVFIDQKERGLDGEGKSAIVVSTRFTGQACDNRTHGGGNFTNLMYHNFKGSGNIDGGNHPDSPTVGGGAHAMDFIGFPAKGAWHRAAPHGMLGGGGRHSEVDSDGFKIADIVFRGTTPTREEGGIRIHYSLVPSTGNPAGTNVDIRWWHDKNHHAPETPCVLTATSHGSLSGLLATDIIIQAGTTYWVEWNAKDAGVTRNSHYTLAGQINIGEGLPLVITDPRDIDGLQGWWNAAETGNMIMDTPGVGGRIHSWTDHASGIFLVQPLSSQRPLYVASANNGLPGVVFQDNTPGEFLFASGSPVDGPPSTMFIIYEPSGVPTGAQDTLLSLSNNLPISGGVTAHDYMSIIFPGGRDLNFDDLDAASTISGSGVRSVVLPSGGQINMAKLAVWRNFSFESNGIFFPSGTTVRTDVEDDGIYEPSGLDNMTFGRFTGSLDAHISGVYAGAGDYFNGVIYEVGFYDRSITDIEIDRLRVYATGKYDLET